MMEDGLIYFVPRIAKNIGIFDPASSSFTTLALSHIISILYYSSKYKNLNLNALHRLGLGFERSRINSGNKSA